MRLGRRIAFDYGQVRIGVAICDPDGILATPLPFIPNLGMNPKSKTYRAIQTLLVEYQPTTIYLGRPHLLSGEHGAAAELVEKFRVELSTLTEIPIRLIDERFSTVSAARRLRDSGVSDKEGRDLIDSMAAVEILNSGLRSEGER